MKEMKTHKSLRGEGGGRERKFFFLARENIAQSKKMVVEKITHSS
jgi:hypothetical protein